MTTLEAPKQELNIHPELTGNAPGRWQVILRSGRQLVGLVAFLVLAVVTLEALLALIGAGEEEYIKLDPILGITHLENKKVTFRSEGFSAEKTNSNGQRDRDHLKAKPPGVVRIAFLGDSKTEALQVPMQSSFVKLIEKDLNTASGPQVEVLNFAMAGYSTGQEYLQYLHRVRDYQPDVTVLMYHVLDNDENVHSGVIQEAAFPRPYFSLDPTGALLIDWTVLDHYLRGDRAKLMLRCDWLRRNSRIWGVLSRFDSNLKTDKTYQAIAKVWRTSLCFLTTPIKTAPCDADTSPVRSALESEARGVPGEYAPNGTDPNSAIQPLRFKTSSAEAAMFNTYLKSHNCHFAVTKALIVRLSAACRESGSRLVLAALPAPSNSMFYFRELHGLRELCSKNDIEFVNLHEHFPLMEPGKPNEYLIQSHFSKAGHRLISNLLVPHLAAAATKQREDSNSIHR